MSTTFGRFRRRASSPGQDKKQPNQKRPSVSYDGVERLILMSDFRKEFKTKMSQPDASTGSSANTFLTYPAVKEVLDKHRLQLVLQNYPWFTDDVLDRLSDSCLRVVATLITIEWPNWEQFKDLFLEKTDQSDRFIRGDHYLPFKTSELGFLEPREYRTLFEREQYTFCPLIIKEGDDEKHDERVRLPFLSSLEGNDGASGVVTRKTVEKYQIQYKSSSAQGERFYNQQTKIMALKTIKNSAAAKKSFRDETKALEAFKKASSTCKAICLCFATFQHGSTLNIVSPWADLDLYAFLRGKYSEFCERAAAFNPRALFDQTRLLAGALHFLHFELNVDGPIECAHYDLKPENILIWWNEDNHPDPSSSTISLNRNAPVGTWKIHDFGISRFRDPQSDAGARPNLVVPGDMIREHSSVDPPRGPGSYLAPEMDRKVGKRVSKFTDMWSLGGIIAMLLAFALGGPQTVGELYGCRVDGYEDDFFYVDNPPRLKPEVKEWLANLAGDGVPVPDREWIIECQTLVAKLLSIEKHDRPLAKNTELQLLKIRNCAPARRLWDPPADNHFLTDENEYPRSTSTRTNTTQTRTATLAGAQHRGIPDPPTRAREPVLALKARPASFSCPTLLDNTAFLRLETPPSNSRAYLSFDGTLAAILGPKSVYLYRPASLIPPQATWSPDSKGMKQVSRNPLQCGFMEITSPDGRNWTSALLAGNYVALLSSTGRDDVSPIAHVYHCEQQGSTSKWVAREVRQLPISENYEKVQLSAKGVVLIVFEEYFALHLDQNGPLDKEYYGQFQAASFTSDGNWLCVWYSKPRKLPRHHWFLMFDMTSGSVSKVKAQKSPIWRAERNSESAQVLIASHHEPVFIACDQHDMVFLIRKDGPEEAEAHEDRIVGTVAGAPFPNDEAAVLIRKFHAVDYPSADSVRILSNGDSASIGLRQGAKLDRSYNTDRCGVALVEEPDGTYLWTCWPDGVFVRKKTSEREVGVRSPS